MFKYGKKAGYMGIALLVLAVLPLVVAAFPFGARLVETSLRELDDALGQELRVAGTAGAQPAAERGNVLYGGTSGKEQRGLRCDGTPCVRALPAQRLHHGCVPQCDQRLLYVFGDYWNGLWLWFLACPFRQRACTHIQWLLRGRRLIVV